MEPDLLWETSRDWYAGSYGGRWTDLEPGTYTGFGDLGQAKKKKKPKGIKKLFKKGRGVLGKGLQMVLSPGGAAESVIPGITTGGIPWIPILIGGAVLIFVLRRK